MQIAKYTFFERSTLSSAHIRRTERWVFSLHVARVVIDEGPPVVHIVLVFSSPWSLLILGGGFKYFLFSPLFGEDSHFD